MSVIMFGALAKRQQTATLGIETDNKIEISINLKPFREIDLAGNVQLGANLLIPVLLDKGENIFTLKVLSHGGPPRVGMSLISDRSKDFWAAWNAPRNF